MSQAPVNKEKASEDRPIAYSYVRFSTAKQELGDSLRRQVAMAREYADKHGLRLSERSFQDLGVSGFKGKNAEDGALGAFRSAVKSGIIASGSYLLIEQFDRLSRDQVTKALRLLLDLVEDLGITVVTMVDGKVWDAETVKDVTNVLTSVILMSRAHEESKAKSKRLSEVWGEKKKKAVEGTAKRIVTSEGPRWLRAKEDKTGFEVIPELAESVRKVYAMRLAGHGVVFIVNRANAEGWPVPGKPPLRKPDETPEEYEQRTNGAMTWHTSLVGRLLRSRAVLGEYQPHKNVGDDRKAVGAPVPGYYPAIIDEDTFVRAQAVRDRRGAFPGRRDASYKNWLQGLLRCACGHSMVRKNKDSKAQPGYARYYCSARNRGVSKCAGANAEQLENAVLYVVSAVAPSHFDGTERIDKLKGEIDALEVDLKARIEVRDNYADAIGRPGKAPLGSLLQRLEQAEAQVAETQAALQRARAEIAELSNDVDGVFQGVLEKARSLSTLDERAELREELGRIIRKVEVFEPQGYIRVHLRGDDEDPIVQLLRPDGILPGVPIEPVH
ncbi:MAG: recombinase family protein [Proteobacteria bacterium]|nr:recombinase family protein [Pseudomonadota bacterium]